MDWKPEAEHLAAQITHPASRWRPVIEAVPRHLFMPRWWTWASPAPGGPGSAVWELREGQDDPGRWIAAAYADRSVVTQIGAQHADHADHSAQVAGRPTSSATLPGLIVQMIRHAMIGSGMDVLDVGTGSGYGTAVLAARLGAGRVTSVDVFSVKCCVLRPGRCRRTARCAEMSTGKRALSLIL